MVAKKSRKKGNKASPAVQEVQTDVAADVAPRAREDSAVSDPDKTSSSKKKREKKSKKPKKTPPPPPEESGSDAESRGGEDEGDDMKLTLEALDAISDDDSDVDNNDDDGSGKEDVEEEDYDAEAAALRNMIQDGKFNSLLKTFANKKSKKESGNSKKQDKEDTKNQAVGEESGTDEEESDGEPEEAVIDASEEDEAAEKHIENNSGEESSSETDDDNEGKAAKIIAQQTNNRNTRDLALKTALQAADRRLPWAEAFAVVAPTPLPFGPLPNTSPAAVAGKKRQRMEDGNDEGEEEQYVDVHDDLKREVSFYDNALESVLLAREKCEEAGIPFARPEDFFAEMVKSDDHMAKIKDRLIFETKKMEAVERRKSNKEQTVMAKERHAHRLAEKAKSKKAHMSAVDDWKKSAERGRSGLGGRVRDDDEDQLRGMSGGRGGGANMKRTSADKRYGFGGKRGRFKQNDSKTLNDMSGYNPRGGFGGIGQKSQGGMGGKKKGGGGGGKKRPGKRARDASKGGR
mmetsp:Transcript_22920/g.55262  ORF Transcript_22920/g.55262 Transcript_22920/m.55262 type:complete len:517 (-) Transcript_22920:97-1647(-)